MKVSNRFNNMKYYNFFKIVTPVIVPIDKKCLLSLVYGGATKEIMVE